MKRILAYGSMLAAMLLSASCQDSLDRGRAGEEMTVSIIAKVPGEMASKAFGDASGVDIVYYELWTSDFSTRLYPAAGSDAAWAEVVGGEAVIDNLKLVRGDSYGILFWAQDKECEAYDVSDLSNVKIDYTVDETAVSGTGTGNEENRDAFYGCETFSVRHDGLDETTFVLKRPFAQINFGAAKSAGGPLGKITFEGYSITMPVAASFDTINGTGVAHADADKQTHTFTATSEASSTELLLGHSHIAMNYVLPVGNGSQLMALKAVFSVSQAGISHEVEHNLTNIPLQANSRTNLYGNLYTAGTEITVDFAGFGEPGDIVDIDEGNN